MLPRTETNSIAAYYLLFSLYDSLGFEVDSETAALAVDNDLRVHFEYSDLNLEMICSLGILPAEISCMQKMLQMSFIHSCTLTADVDGKVLLTVQMPQECSDTDLVQALQGVIQIASEARRDLGLISVAENNY